VKLVLASGNAGKVRELAAMLAPLGHDVVPQSAFQIETPPETGATFLENAMLKARHAARMSGLPALADDSGIEVDALGGRPGIYSARYAGEGATDQQNLKKLLDELQGVSVDRRAARYQCVVVLTRMADDPAPVVAHGTWQGRIVAEPCGTGGFGYDPIFQPEGLHVTAAELAPEDKNARSHRGQALRALVEELRKWHA
jgi:XTP/dITP diphosphohydrolase